MQKLTFRRNNKAKTRVKLTAIQNAFALLLGNVCKLFTYLIIRENFASVNANEMVAPCGRTSTRGTSIFCWKKQKRILLGEEASEGMHIP